jgi:hypothetical protein
MLSAITCVIEGCLSPLRESNENEGTRHKKSYCPPYMDVRRIVRKDT